MLPSLEAANTGAVSTGADRKANFGGGGALEVGDLRLVEDGSQRSGALGSDVVASETASEGQDGNSERVGVSMGADTKANMPNIPAHSSSVISVSLRMAASAVTPFFPMLLSPRL